MTFGSGNMSWVRGGPGGDHMATCRSYEEDELSAIVVFLGGRGVLPMSVS